MPEDDGMPEGLQPTQGLGTATDWAKLLSGDLEQAAPGAVDAAQTCETLPHSVATELQATILFYSCPQNTPEGKWYVYVLTPDDQVHVQPIDVPDFALRRPAGPMDGVRVRGTAAAEELGLFPAPPDALRADPAPQSAVLDGRLERLYAALIAPVEGRLPDPTTAPRPPTLIVVPSGPLWGVPFQALRPEGGPYLVQRFAVAYAPALWLLPPIQRRLRGEAGGPQALGAAPLIVGCPAGDPALPPIPCAEAEARAVQRILGAPDGAVLLGDAARPGAVLRALADCTCLHVACHAVDGAKLEPHSLYSGALCLAATGPGTGRLYSEQLARRMRRCRLATLSACSTFRGPAFHEGLLGIPHTLLRAGAAGVVTTMWPVSDACTMALMRDFYAALQPRPPGAAGEGPGPHAVAQALRRALCGGIAAGMPVERWAPFLLYGL